MTVFKKGLDYYSFDTDTFQNLNVKRLKRECKATGIAVYTYLLCELYRVEGYYLHITPALIFDVADNFGISEEEVQHIIRICTQVEIFHEKFYKEKQILTSKEIQSRYLSACQKLRRNKIQILSSLQLIELPEEIQTTDNKEDRKSKKTNLSKNSERTPSCNEPLSATFSPTKRREEMKRDEMKGEEKKLLPPTPPTNGRGDAEAVNTLRLSKQSVDILPLPATHDNLPRNYSGMVQELLRQKVETADINAILRLSNFGIIGHPAWKALHTVTVSPGKFKFPGKFILSEIRKFKL